jgi:hypothetical protein
MGLGPPQLLKVTSHTYLALGHEELLWHLEDHAHDGWFLQSMSMYGPPDAPLYAAVFLPLPDDGKPPIEQRIDGPMAVGWSPQAAIEARANEFYRPTIVGMTAWGPHSAVTLVFARQLEPVFRRVGPRKFAYPLPPPSRISIGSFFDLSDANIAGAYHQGDRQRLTLVSAAATAGTDTTAPLFATVWSKFDTRTSWNLLWVDAPYGEGINPQWRSDWRAKSIERGWARFVSVMPVRGQDGPRGLRYSCRATRLSPSQQWTQTNLPAEYRFTDRSPGGLPTTSSGALRVAGHSTWLHAAQPRRMRSSRSSTRRSALTGLLLGNSTQIRSERSF